MALRIRALIVVRQRKRIGARVGIQSSSAFIWPPPKIVQTHKPASWNLMDARNVRFQTLEIQLRSNSPHLRTFGRYHHLINLT